MSSQYLVSKETLPLWVCAFPAWEGVGGEATVDQGQVGLVVRVTQVLKVAPQLTRVQLTLQWEVRRSQLTRVQLTL